MKTILIYGEFLPKSSTGIAYVNSLLESCLKKFGYKVTRLLEPRTNDYSKSSDKIIKKNYNIYEFIKLLFQFLKLEINDISFITLSMGNLGLLKTLIIQFFLNIKSKRIYLYIHRGDLHSQYEESLYKKIIINLILNKSYRVIFLSEIFRIQNVIKNLEYKSLVIPNSLNLNDSKLAKRTFNKVITSQQKNSKILKLLFCSNIQREKGIDNIIKAVQIFNNANDFKIHLDIYGMRFQDIIEEDKYIKFKGKLTTENRLLVMSQYDCLILASLTEGLPITLIECLSIGIPFITTKVGAINDLLIENYPYICSNNVKSIIYNLDRITRDFKYNKKLIRKIKLDNYDLFNKKYNYKNFEKNIKQLIY